ncbi:MAG: TIGR01777 family oxidoreductase [Verrucomicrobiota bacterium]
MTTELQGKRIGITGVSGMVGQALAERLRNNGAEVIGFSRTPKEGQRSWAKPTEADYSGLDGLVHLAGESVLGRWTPAKKQRILSSRVEGTRGVVEGLGRLAPEERPAVLVSASAIGIYGERGDAVLPEYAAPGDGFLADVTTQWEAEAQQAADLGIRVMMPRIGVVLGPSGGAARIWKLVFGLGMGGKLGDGKQWVSWIGLDDLVSILEDGLIYDVLQGPVNAASPNPMRNADLSQVIGEVMRRPSLIPAPAFGMRFLMGEMAAVMLQSQRVEPAILRQAGFQWKTPKLRAALEDAFRS